MVLTKALEAMKESGTTEPTDDADILYNFAVLTRLAELAEGAGETRFKELVQRFRRIRETETRECQRRNGRRRGFCKRKGRG